MAFTDEQREALKAKLRYRHVRTRAHNGAPISYVEGWHVIAEANRIFGYDSWDRQTLSPRCLWRESQRGETACFYTAKVRITVRAGAAMIVREGIGTGVGRASAAEAAHEIALKAAETDATKRALATFGNPFGLALYDKEQRGVTRRPRRDAHTAGDAHAQADRHADAGAGRDDKRDADRNIPLSLPPPLEFELQYSDRSARFTTAEAFVAATLEAVRALSTVKRVYAFWEANLDSFVSLLRAESSGTGDSTRVIGSALKDRIRTLARAEHNGEGRDAREVSRATGSDQVAVPGPPRSEGGGARNDAPATLTEAPGQLAFPKEQRIRDKAHLTFVANEPCLVCGRRPAQAHHIRFAQPRALGLKVSDEFTVPLCNGHHDSLHNTGDERAWWARHGILNPLQIADRLWAASRRDKCDAEPPIAAASNGRPTLEVPTGQASDEPPW